MGHNDDLNQRLKQDGIDRLSEPPAAVKRSQELRSIRRGIGELAGAILEDDEVAERAGKALAAAFFLRRDPKNHDRWQTDWGSKTNIGLARTLIAQMERGLR